MMGKEGKSEETSTLTRLLSALISTYKVTKNTTKALNTEQIKMKWELLIST